MKLHSAHSSKLVSSGGIGWGILKLGSIYPRYVGPRLIIPGGKLDGGYVRLDTLGRTEIINNLHYFRSFYYPILNAV